MISAEISSSVMRVVAAVSMKNEWQEDTEHGPTAKILNFF